MLESRLYASPMAPRLARIECATSIAPLVGGV